MRETMKNASRLGEAGKDLSFAQLGILACQLFPITLMLIYTLLDKCAPVIRLGVNVLNHFNGKCDVNRYSYCVLVGASWPPLLLLFHLPCLHLLALVDGLCELFVTVASHCRTRAVRPFGNSYRSLITTVKTDALASRYHKSEQFFLQAGRQFVGLTIVQAIDGCDCCYFVLCHVRCSSKFVLSTVLIIMRAIINVKPFLTNLRPIFANPEKLVVEVAA